MRRGERGQSTVELALVIVPFLLLLIGVFDLGRTVFYTHMLTQAAREGARAGVIPARTADQICVRAAAFTQLPDTSAVTRCGAAGSLTVTATAQGTVGSTSDPRRWTVTLTYAFAPVTPLISQIVGSSISLSAASSMTVEA